MLCVHLLAGLLLQERRLTAQAESRPMQSVDCRSSCRSWFASCLQREVHLSYEVVIVNDYTGTKGKEWNVAPHQAPPETPQITHC